MSYTEVTNQGWFSRLADSIKGILFGILLFLAAFPLLFWNEGRAVRQDQAIAEGRGAVVSVASDRVDPAHQDQLVHVSGQATATGTLRDDEFGVEGEGALRLRRTAEMYQWKQTSRTETRKKVGGGEEKITTYDYERVWSDRPIDSSEFKQGGHQNPGEFPVQGQTWEAPVVRLGAFTLGQELTSRIDAWQDLPETGTPPRGMVASGGGFYQGANPAEPQVGDVRVRFQAVPATQVSVVAVQSGDSFQPFQTRSGNPILELAVGQKTAEQMFQTMEDTNTLMTWLLRAAGFFCMFLGLVLILNPLSVLADVLPFLGNLVGFGTGLVAFMLATSLSMTTISLGWLAYRPLLGVGLLAVAFVALVAVIRLLRGRKAG